MYKLFVLALSLTMISACAGNGEQIAREDYYDEDGYMGMTNANPGLVTTPNSYNYGADIEMMKKALRDVTGIEKSLIMVDGAAAIIHIHVTPGLSKEETLRIRENAKRRLSEQIPKWYEIRVTVNQ